MEGPHSTPVDWRDGTTYDTVYKARPSKVILSRIGQEAYGDDFPEEAEPMSFVTKTDLARMVYFLAIGS